jgi:site-specific DNA-methyltransferase (adenine-specific)
MIEHGSAEEFLLTFEGDEAQLIWTDPPYGNGNQDGDLAASRVGVDGARQQEARPIANDRPEDYEPTMRAFLRQASRVLDPDGALCVCCSAFETNQRPAELVRWMEQTDLAFDCAVVWDKLAAGPGLGWVYRRSYELILVAHRKDGRLRHPDRGRTLPNVLHHSPVRERLHPNEKPAGLVREFILLHTAPGDLVVDPFCGSGTTGVAAITTGRRFSGCDLDASWASLSRERIEAAKRTNTLAGVRAGQPSLWEKLS